jgi:hypothetical protein
MRSECAQGVEIPTEYVSRFGEPASEHHPLLVAVHPSLLPTQRGRRLQVCEVYGDRVRVVNLIALTSPVPA